MAYWTGRRNIIIFFFVTFLTLAPARAERGTTISIGFSTGRILDPGFDYISEDNYHDEFNVEAGYEFYKNLSASGSYCYSRESGGDITKTTLITHCSQLGVRYTLSYLRQFQPFLDAGLIYYWGKLIIEDPYTSLKKRDYTIGLAGDIGIYIYPFKKMDLFLRFSAGYLLNSHFDNLPLNFGRFGVLEMEGRRYVISAGYSFK